MKIKEVVQYLNNVPTEKINKINIDFIRQEKTELSNSDKRFLLKELKKFKDYSADYIFCIILIYSIWQPDEAISEARKKGIFRYNALGMKKNNVEFLLKRLEEFSSVIPYSVNTKMFFKNKLSLSWLFDFYKKNEQDLVKAIKERHQKSLKIKRDQNFYEESLFKELLVYADLIFSRKLFKSNDSSDIKLNKNKIESYEREEIFDGISYLIYLYDETIGIKQNVNYTVSSNYVFSNDIEKIILRACKVIQIQEWEITIDFFDYKIASTGDKITIYDSNHLFEKSIRLGFIKRDIQEQIFYEKISEVSSNSQSISEIVDYITNSLGNKLIKEVNSGELSRYRLEFPEELLNYFSQYKDKFFREEWEIILYNARERAINPDEFLNKKITENCYLRDIILFQRFFYLLNQIIFNILFTKKDKNKIAKSLIPHIKYEVAYRLISKFIGSEKKAKELLEFFKYKNHFKFDLQYTPFIESSDGLFFSNAVVSKSNLLRNCIAHSYTIKNQIVNQHELEPLVKECVDIFSENLEIYKVFPNQKFTFSNKSGEIDLLVISEEDIIIIECKSPLNPTSNFELRSSIDHVNKGVKQLNHCKCAFMDKSFRKQYLKSLGVADKPRSIHTCIVFGNRLLNGHSIDGHPIRYVRELDMIINDGHIHSSLATWRVWKEEKFKNEELISFLSPNHPLIVANFKSMEKITEYMYVKDKKMSFETYSFNFLTAVNYYDTLFFLKNNNEGVRKKILATNDIYD